MPLSPILKPVAGIGVITESRVEAIHGREVGRASRRPSRHVPGADVVRRSIETQAAVAGRRVVEARHVEAKAAKVGEAADILRQALHVLYGGVL